jgi:hypothetical protein
MFNGHRCHAHLAQTAVSNIQSGTSTPRDSCRGSNPQWATIRPWFTRVRKIQTVRPNQGATGKELLNSVLWVFD